MEPLNAHIERGWDLVNQGDVQGAWQSAQRSLEVNDRSAEAHHLMGYVKSLEGKSEEALDHYQQAIDLEEGFIEAMLSAAELMIHPLNNLSGAHALIDEAADYAESPDELADVLLLRVDALIHEGRLEDAAQTAQRLPEGPFENPQLEFLIGRAWLDLGNLKKAEPLLLAAKRKFPEHADVEYSLGTLYAQSGKMSEATAAFLKTRQLDADGARPAWTLSMDAFEALVRQTIQQCSHHTRKHIAASTLILSDIPGAEVVGEGVDPRAMIWWDSDPLGIRPPRLFIYQKNLERSAGTPSDLQSELIACLEDGVSEIELSEIASKPPPPLSHVERNRREES